MSVNLHMKRFMREKSVRQLFSYALIGAVTNLSGYALYLLLTYLGCTPKLAMTLLYLGGALLGFFANRRFTFQHNGHIGRAGTRYLLAQLLGYLLNLTLLLVFVDWMGFAHEIIQAIAIVVVAFFLFILSRFFVFTPRTAGNTGVCK